MQKLNFEDIKPGQLYTYLHEVTDKPIGFFLPGTLYPDQMRLLIVLDAGDLTEADPAAQCYRDDYFNSKQGLYAHNARLATPAERAKVLPYMQKYIKDELIYLKTTLHMISPT